MPEKKEWWFMELIEEKLKTVTSYHGVIVNVRLDEARLPDGSTAKREVVEHPGGVTVLPLEADGTVWCVRQYRYPFSRTLLELPAGKLEPGEAPERRRRASSRRRRDSARDGCSIWARTSPRPATRRRCCTFTLRAICTTARRTLTPENS